MYKILKEICYQACRERGACANGFKDMMLANDATEMMKVWRKYWEDIYTSKYADIVNNKFAPIYECLKKEINSVGIFYNEIPTNTSSHTMVLVGDNDQFLTFRGDLLVFIIGKCHVTAYDNVQVFSRAGDSFISLKGYANGNIKKGYVVCDDHSVCICEDRCETHGLCSVTIKGGKLVDYGHKNITMIGGEIHSANLDKVFISKETKIIYEKSYSNNIKK